MSDAVRFDARLVLVGELGEVRTLLLPEDPAWRPLSTDTAPFAEPCECCGDATSRLPGHGRAIVPGAATPAAVPGVCRGCWGTGRALFAWTVDPGPALPVHVPAELAAPWLAARAPVACHPAPSWGLKWTRYL